jgi:hypothetical protein
MKYTPPPSFCFIRTGWDILVDYLFLNDWFGAEVVLREALRLFFCRNGEVVIAGGAGDLESVLKDSLLVVRMCLGVGEDRYFLPVEKPVVHNILAIL